MSAILIAKGRDQGFLLSDEIIAAFPNVEADVSGLDEFYSSLLEFGIEVVDQSPTPLKRPAADQNGHSDRQSQNSNGHAETAQTPTPLPSGVADDAAVSATRYACISRRSARRAC
jgi:hypothetical protein